MEFVETQSDKQKCSAPAPKSLWEANKIFRNNSNPNTRITVDASQLTVEQASKFSSNGYARGVVQGASWFVHGQVELQRNSNGSISLSSDRYSFEPHDVSKYSSAWRGYARNIETYFGFYAATYGGLTEYWADLTGGNHATDFTFDFDCEPTVK